MKIKNKLSKSTRKFIRQEKARIRREGLGLEEKNKRVQELYERFMKKAVVAKPDGANFPPKAGVVKSNEKNDKKNKIATIV